ncbi:hypothetical protein Vadar_010681 [Vaccinium darrowii]|uniref:Uncharacterized protein n=1 Tax=Vaccinium darrowii TaxID=229202 RepID=A0ACB7XHW3_9ERIC|nr:hypothetical protein Vadar_010681 [Vaccinium darrowii]
MAKSEAKIETTEIAIRDGEERRNNPNPILCFLSKFQFFNFPPQKRDAAKSDAVNQKPGKSGEYAEEGEKAVVVKVPNAKTDLPSLKLEGEECERNTNPIVLWQVYAIGGFFVLSWALARWKEKRAKKKSSDDEPSPDDN